MAVASLLAITMLGSSFNCKAQKLNNANTTLWSERETDYEITFTRTHSKLKLIPVQVYRTKADLMTNLLSQFLVLGSQGLAVAAPRSIELNQNILRLIVHNISKVLSNNNLEKKKQFSTTDNINTNQFQKQSLSQ